MPAAAPDLAPFRVAHAAGENWRELAEACLDDLVPTERDRLGLVYVSDRFAGDFEVIVSHLRRRTGIADWFGASAIGICAADVEYFDTPAIAVMLGALPDGSHFFIDSTRGDLEAAIARHRPVIERAGLCFAMVQADSRNAQAVQALPALAEQLSGYLVGALTASRGPHGQIAGEFSEGGLTALVLAGDVPVASGLTQGCQPIGEAHTVTEAQDNIIVSLDGEPALDVFKRDIGEVLARDLRRVAGYIFAAVPVQGTDWNDYLVRNLTAIDPDQGLIAIGDAVEVGQSVMFCRRDRQAALADLQRMVADVKRRIDRPALAAVYFSCLARGPNMFDGDASELKTIQQALGDLPLIGFFGNGEIANARLYTYTGVLNVIMAP